MKPLTVAVGSLYASCACAPIASMGAPAFLIALTMSMKWLLSAPYSMLL